LATFFRSDAPSGITGTTLSPGAIRPDCPTVIPCAGQKSVCGHSGKAYLIHFVFTALAARKKNVLNAGFRKRMAASGDGIHFTSDPVSNKNHITSQSVDKSNITSRRWQEGSDRTALFPHVKVVRIRITSQRESSLQQCKSIHMCIPIHLGQSGRKQQ
jgi:hypothetical protein